MAKYKKPLSQNPFNHWSYALTGAGAVDPDELIDALINGVADIMSNKFGMPVSANKELVTVGGIFSSNDFPGVIFNFDGKGYAGFLVGIQKVASVLQIDVVQHGEISSAMRRMNDADSKGMFSISGALQRAVTDQSAVEEESLHYQALVQSIQEVVHSWEE